MQVHIGRQYLTQYGMGYDVRATNTTAIHGAYNPATSANDIALLLLSAPSTKAPVALAAGGLNLAQGTPLTAIGFGTTSEGSAYLSGEPVLEGRWQPCSAVHYMHAPLLSPCMLPCRGST